MNLIFWSIDLILTRSHKSEYASWSLYYFYKTDSGFYLKG